MSPPPRRRSGRRAPGTPRGQYTGSSPSCRRQLAATSSTSASATRFTNDAEDRAALVLERRPARPEPTRAVSARRAALDDDEHRGAELVREVGVQTEVERRDGTARSRSPRRGRSRSVARAPCTPRRRASATPRSRRSRSPRPARAHTCPRAARRELVAAANQLDLGIGLRPGRHDRAGRSRPARPAPRASP